MTKRWLTKHGLEHKTIDLTRDMVAYDYVTGVLNYKQTPVVEVDDPAMSWSGFKVDKLKQLLERTQNK